jgi:hypothetical protein
MMVVLLSGCKTLGYGELYRQMKPYEGFEGKLSESLDMGDLPSPTSQEVYLFPKVRSDGILENRWGSGGRCVYVFEVDPKARRMVGWRFAAKYNPSECQPKR